MNVIPMSAPLGVEVHDVDLKALSDNSWLAIQKLFLAHHVVVFPNQSMTPSEQLNFGRRWGNLLRHPYFGLPEYPDLIELKNAGKSKDVNQHWHSDMTFQSKPPKLTMLYALETPDIGGDTAFANQVLAYQELSHGIKSVIDRLSAEHTGAGLAALSGADARHAPTATHPVVRTHDETLDKALFVCRAFTQKFTNWTRNESLGLLETLFDHSTRPEFQARHRWHPGDLVMWDNRAVLHYAVHDHGDAPRLIHRLQVEGPIPV